MKKIKKYKSISNSKWKMIIDFTKINKKGISIKKVLLYL